MLRCDYVQVLTAGVQHHHSPEAFCSDLIHNEEMSAMDMLTLLCVELVANEAEHHCIEDVHQFCHMNLYNAAVNISAIVAAISVTTPAALPSFFTKQCSPVQSMTPIEAPNPTM